MRWLRRIVNVFVSGRVERDIRREVSFHIAERTDDLRASGLSEAEAARQARARFGNPTLQAERTRDVDVARWLDTFLRDLRYAARSLARSPAFTLTVVLTLALAIGANTAVFSALDAVLFRPLPFPDADRLVQVSQTQQRSSGTFIAPARLQDWVRLNTAFDALAGYYVEDASETSGDLPERVRRAFVTPQFFDVWGILPAQGRAFEPGEYRFGGTAAVVVSDRFWRQRLGADPNVLGRQIRLGTASIPIVGVMPATFRFPDRTVDLWMAVSVDAPYAQSRQMTWYTGIGRLRPGVTPAQARENLMAVQTQLAEQHPDTDRGLGAGVVPLDQSTVGDAGSSLWLLFGAVTVLLLIACTNIAALLLSRATARRHEIAVRFSLGASRRAVAAQLLTEAAVLAAAGAAAGLLLAYGAAGALRVAAGDLPRIEDMAIDSRVLLYTLVATIGVALLCGLIPAIRTAGLVSRRDDGRVQVSSRSPLQWLLVGTQVALAVMLLAAAGLLLRSVHELSLVNRGFDADRVLAFRMSGSWGETADLPRLRQRINGTIDALRALPGVEAAATTGWALPGVPEQWETTFEVVEARHDATQPPILAEGRAVSPEYFETMRIPLLAGEACRREGPIDGANLLVNQTFASRYLAGWPSPMGLHVRDIAGASGTPGRIVGVVGDARERGLHRDPGPIVYWCFSAPNPTPYFLVRTRGEPEAIAQTIRVRMKEMEPLRSVYDVAPLEAQIGEAFAENRLRTQLLALFAAAALALACIGLYGTLSYVVGLRRREVGLRLALGALRRQIVGTFVGQGLRVVVIAAVCGVALSLASGRLLAGMLFGVSPSDPATLAGVVGLVLAVAALAVLVPALRAARVEPMQVLREE
jgi:putative ABC transport system permease protein